MRQNQRKKDITQNISLDLIDSEDEAGRVMEMVNSLSFSKIKSIFPHEKLDCRP
jgi:hypothetical protein